MAKGIALDQMSTKPTYYTTLGPIYPDGRCRSSMDGTVWLYRSVPLAPVIDARDDHDAMAAMDPLFRAYEEMARLVSAASRRRYTARTAYRRTHALLINNPQYFHMPWGHPLGTYLNRGFKDETVDHRLLLFGVQLRDQVGGGGTMRDRIDSLAAFFADKQIPLADFDVDFARVDAALSRAGLSIPTPAEFKLADAYWNYGDTPATPRLNHMEHMHVFHSPESMGLAELFGTENCEALEAVPRQGAITYASLTDFDFEWSRPTDPVAAWASELIARDAMVISIRGLVEPAKITREELRRQRQRFIRDIEERRKQNKLSRAEQDEMLRDLQMVEDHYANDGANPILTEASIIVGFSGIKDVDSLKNADLPVKLAPMTLLQPGAMAETWLCSNVRANPRLHDIPIQVVAASGITSLSFVGDREDGRSALFGFTERDRQPAWLSSTAASTADGLPIFLCVGATGSGKSMIMLNLADQWTRAGRPGVIVDPKPGSDHSAVVEACGGQVIRLDDIRQSDGIFDPIRFWPAKDIAIELATSMLQSINVWGSRQEDMEAPLGEALRYGVDHGATCTGEALAIAESEMGDRLPDGLIHPILAQTKMSPMFAALCGTNPQSEALNVTEKLTLIMVGEGHLDIPLPGHAPESLGQRIALALIRMMVFGSAAALRGKGGGFVALDEAWAFLGAGAAEVERVGRLARSMEVLPCLFTQRVTDATNANLAGYISRIAIGPIEDREEAIAACRLAKLDPDKYVPRITLKGTRKGSSQARTIPNPESMHALKNPDTGEVERGAIFIYQDLNSNAIPTEVKLTREFHWLASTNPEDIAARKRAREQAMQRDTEIAIANGAEIEEDAHAVV
jgi:hypothetical protein